MYSCNRAPRLRSMGCTIRACEDGRWGASKRMAFAKFLQIISRVLALWLAITTAIASGRNAERTCSLLGERSFEDRERQCVRGGRAPIARQTLISGLAKTLNNCYILFNSGGCHGCADPHVDRDRGAHCA